MSYKPILALYSLWNGLYGEKLVKFLDGACGTNPPEYSLQIGVITVITAVIFCLIFYFPMASNDLYARKYYLVVLGLNCLAAFITAQVVLNSALNSKYICDTYKFGGGSIFIFSFVNVIYALLAFLVASLILKRYGSSNARHIPFNFKK
ncbi:MAG: hypothetical protein WBA74_09670 [Cyclobacteriaceae bacterium]